MPGLAPRMNDLFRGQHDFQISFSNRDTSRNAWNRHWGSFFCWYGDLIKQYEVPLSRMLNDILYPDQIQWQSSTDQTIPIRDLLPNSTFYRIMRGFRRTFATGVAVWQGTLTPPDTRSRPIWDLIAYVLATCWGQSFSRTCIFSGHPSVLFRFCSVIFDKVFSICNQYMQHIKKTDRTHSNSMTLTFSCACFGYLKYIRH